MQVVLLLVLFLLLSNKSSSTSYPAGTTKYPPGAYPPGVAPPANYYPPQGSYPGNSSLVGVAAAAAAATLASKFGSGVQPPQAPTSGYYNYGANAYTSGTPGPPPSTDVSNASFYGIGQASTSSFTAYAPGASAPGPYAPSTDTAGGGDSLLPAYGDAATTPDTSLLTA